VTHVAYDGFRTVIKAVGTGPHGSRDLGFDEAREATAALLRGDVAPAQAGAFLVAMRMKGEAAAELAGAAAALADAAVPLHADTDRPLVACAGSYDGMGRAPSLSLAAGVAAAACGAGIVLHCGDTLGPKYGVTSADVLAALGGPAAPSPDESRAMLERAGITLVHAGKAIPGWRALAEIRNQVGVRGPLHSAEKLLGWFGARRFVVGHTHSSYTDRLVAALDALGAERAVAVRGLEGSDVLRPGRPLAFTSAGPLELPERLGDRLAGEQTAAEAAAATRAVLAGERDGLLAYTVALSAGLRLWAAGLAADVPAGARVAEQALADGRAEATLAAFVGP
jgi:anthranilate phosphoribosyltransferase